MHYVTWGHQQGSGHARTDVHLVIAVHCTDAFAVLCSHKHKIDYMTAIRPDTETTSQLMRMMGTYETDYPHAARATVHIPPSCPANPPSYFHPGEVQYRGAAEGSTG
jgi:hypothetical protein